MVRLALVAASVLAFAGCKTENKAFCANPANAGLEGCPGDATNGGACGSNGDCKLAGFPICDTTMNNGTCVQCTDTMHDACSGTTPVCKTDACVACTDDANDCGGGVCMIDGSCASAGAIIHATSGSTASIGCGDIGTPCSLPGALSLVSAIRNVIKLDGGGTFLANGFMVSSDVTIDARGATLSRTGGGAVLTVMGGKSLTLLGGIVRGSPGGAEGIKCNGSTLTVVDTRVDSNDQNGINSDMCMLDLRRVSVISNSQKSNTFVPGINVSNGSIALSQSRIEANNGGGLSISSAVFTIVGNVFFNNGPLGAPPPNPQPAISISTSSNPSNRFDFNTVVSNHSQGGVVPGLQCAAGNLLVRNNILWLNNDNIVAQFGGNCVPTYSDVGFVSVDMDNNTHVDPLLTSDQHLMMLSPLIGKADPGSSLTGIAAKDIDGEPRVARPGMGPDIGADQYSSRP